MSKSWGLREKQEIIKALGLRGRKQEELFRWARKARDEIFGGRVEVRSVIEYSNICVQSCLFCAMHISSGIRWYALTRSQMLEQVEKLYNSGRRLIMIQSGELRAGEEFRRLCGILEEIKFRYSDVSLLCGFGNLSFDDYRRLRDIGIERYLLKFETSDPALYRRIKPTDTLANRLRHVEYLKKLGFMVSSGNIIGLPGQDMAGLAGDILLLRRLDIPMGATFTFVPTAGTAFAGYPKPDINTTLNFIAVLRLFCPSMVIAATSSLEMVSRGGQMRGLLAGANAVTIHDGIPRAYASSYPLHGKFRYEPGKELFRVIERAGMTASAVRLARAGYKDSVFYALIHRHIKSGRPALFADGKQYTYADLYRLTLACSSWMKSKGLGQGDRAVLALYDSLEFVISFLSCLRLGIVAVLADPSLSSREYRDINSSIKPKLFLSTFSAAQNIKPLAVVALGGEDSSDVFLALLKNIPADNEEVAWDANNPAIMLFTSGTTGEPKAAVHTYKDLLVDIYPRTVLRLSYKDRIFSCSRIFSSYGLGNSVLFPFQAGASVILSRSVPNPFALSRILALRPTIFCAVPSMYDFLLSHALILRRGFRGVRVFVSGGEKLDKKIFREWERAFGKKILEHYGSSEMCHPIASHFIGKENSTSCGKVLEGFSVRCGRNKTVYYRGPSLFCGYYADPQLTHKNPYRGWFESDDLGRIDSRGYLYLEGRKNALFKAHGVWVNAVSLEAILKRHPLVKDAHVFCDVGVRRTACAMVLRKGADEAKAEASIRRWCFYRMKPHERPGRICFCHRVKRLRSGKIDRKSVYLMYNK